MSKKNFPDYLSFTRKERTGIIIIMVLIITFTLLPFLFPFFIRSKPVDHSQFEKEIASLHIKQQDTGFKRGNNDEYNDRSYDQPSEKKYYSKEPRGELFYFDPNTLPAEGWVRLGIKEKTAATIQKYISKGGKFYKPEDIGKIWGLHEDEIKRLIPYVRIEQGTNAGPKAYGNTEPAKTYEKPKYTLSVIDINTADTSAYIALPGIGSKLANRIIAFRDKLGGFYKVEQVAEIYGLPDSTFQKIKDRLIITNTSVKKLNINSATLDELKMHPYLRYNIANAIVQYRTQHGDFSAVNDLKKIMLISDEIFVKVEPYLSVK